MAPQSRPLFTALYVIGLALLAVGVYLLVPRGMSDALAILDFLVLAAVYSVNFPLLSFGWTRTLPFETRLPALSILWVCTTTYSVLALGALGYMTVAAVPFRFQLLVHLVLLFGVGVASALASWSASHTAMVAGAESALASGLKELRATLTSTEDALTALGAEWHPERQALARLKEDARFLAPSDRERESALEHQLIAELKAMRVLLGAQEPALLRAGLGEKLTRCQTLMSMRKQPNIRQGESS